MRLAFITPEFVTDYTDGGGLATYLNRIGQSLIAEGHEVEVFLTSNREPRVLEYGGVRVERSPNRGGLGERLVQRAATVVGVGFPCAALFPARRIARALESRHRQVPYDVVQSADYMCLGLLVKRKKGRVHLVRCSWAADLYNRIDGTRNRDSWWRERLERRAMRLADGCYAPSRFIAAHYAQRHGLFVHVLRPPMVLEAIPATAVPCGLPDRFLIHFGALRVRKGTAWLCASLKIAFRRDPSLRMVWIGRAAFDELSILLASLGEDRAKVQVLFPMEKPQLYSVLRRAEGAVLPSLVDNLPNTVSESLLLGIPVVGTTGASIDELVEHGVTGELVSPGDVEGLADAMIRVWSGQSTARKGFIWNAPIIEAMKPETAVRNLLQLARSASARPLPEL